ncbi:MAG TPA: quinone-dependent dihydroorotate dehydrogenase [Alphaproteobacteria bacterium]
MADFWHLATTCLRLLPPERAHGTAIWALKSSLVPRQSGHDDPILRTNVFGLDFVNPIGLAAGFDKNAEVPDAMLALGFGFVEIGTVTPRPQRGNPRPRLFRLSANRALINRLGFNNEGLDTVGRRLALRGRGGIVGANLGKNKDSVDAEADYRLGVAALAEHADYLVVNVSSPNTPGLRALQGKEPLDALIAAVQAARANATGTNRPPILLKIAPDMTADDCRDIASVALARGLDGLIVGNTTISRPPGIASARRSEAGGLSGRPLYPLASRVVAEMSRLTEARIPIVGVGGIASGGDAYDMIRRGASLVQLYTALVFDGPTLLNRIKTEIAAQLRHDGFKSVAEAVGAAHRR